MRNLASCEKNGGAVDEPLSRPRGRRRDRVASSDSSQLNGRLAYREPAAAALLDVPVHRLRDARLRGEIVASKLGKSYLYQREELLDYLRRNRQT